MTRYRVITFDLDDTLWDVRPALLHAEASTRAWLTANAPATAERFDAHAFATIRQELVADDPSLAHRISQLRRDVYARAFERTGHSRDEASRLADAAFAVFQHARNRVEPYPGVAELLASLAQRFVLGALSNGNAELHRLPIGIHFAFHISADHVRAAKPDPAMFEAALDRSGVAPAELLHVGDNPEHDVLGAANAGVDCVWINATDAPFPDHVRAMPVARLRGVLELPAWLANQPAPATGR